MDERQRAAWRALGLGPIWAQRVAAGQVQADIELGMAADTAAAARARIGDPALESAVIAQTAREAEAPLTDRHALAAGPAEGETQTVDLFAGDHSSPPPAAPSEPAHRLLRLNALRSEVAGCPKCRLCQSRTQTVFGVGTPDARWMFIGEAPGAEEDARGDPFVGQAGRLLDAMLASIGLDRMRDVYIANVIKCRPPGNRNPQPDEVASCEPYLREQIALVQPTLLVLLGRFAAQTLLRTQVPVGSLRGRVHLYQNGAQSVPAVVTFHPAYLLRNPVDKAKAWRDLCLARAQFSTLQRAGSVA